MKTKKEILKHIKNEELGKEYNFCFMSNKLVDFKNNIEKLKNMF